MAQHNLLISMNRYEDQLISRFQNHPVFLQLTHASWADMHKILLQRRFLSHIFTPIYDLVTDSLTDAESIKVVRHLIREEYPDEEGNQPSHRENLMYDLQQLGLTRQEILTALPTRSTVYVIKKSYEYIQNTNTHSPESLRNIELMLMVRFWGEILVSAEYGSLWSKLSERLDEKKSLFYYPHYIHDQKRKALQATSETGLLTHTDLTNSIFARYLHNDEARACFKAKEKELFKLKYGFYNQFLQKNT